VSAFSRDSKTGKLTLINQTSSRGGGPCHLVVDKTGRNVLVANYNTGSIAAIPLREDGGVKEASGFVQHTGSSVDPRRQTGPHAHSINLSADNRFAVVADLGLDKLLVYRFDPAAGSLTPNEPPSIAIKPGSGPRHFAFHPNGKFAYQINEMASTVGALSWDAAAGAFKHLQYVSTLPADFKGSNTTAEVQVHPSGKFVYGSNRGHDTVAAFSVNAKDGTLTYVGNYGAGGKVIRNFGIDPTGKYLFAAHQNSNFIAVFRIDPKTGKLTPTGQTLNAGAPVCVKFARAE
jgi:6-phosphogluconolactonase